MVKYQFKDLTKLVGKRVQYIKLTLANNRVKYFSKCASGEIRTDFPS